MGHTIVERGEEFYSMLLQHLWECLTRFLLLFSSEWRGWRCIYEYVYGKQAT